MINLSKTNQKNYKITIYLLYTIKTNANKNNTKADN